MRRPRHALAGLALAALALAAGARSAAAGSYAEARAAICDGWAVELEALAAWCNKVHLFKARNEVAETLIAIDGDHERARGWLKYKRSKGGTWERRSSWKPPSDRKPELRPEFDTRLAAIVAEVRPRAVAAIRDATPPLTFRERAEAVAWWRPHVGDDPELLALAGLVQHEGAWRAAGTVRSLRRRTAIAKAAKAARARKHEIEPVELGAEEQAIDLPWKAGRRAGPVRVFGTASPSFHASIAKIVHATRELADTLYGGTLTLPETFSLYVMKGDDAFERVVDEHPSVQGNRAVLRSLSGCWLAHNAFVDRMSTSAGSLDSAIGVTMQVLLARRFGEGDPRWMPGWVADGFSLYAMTHLTGTHLSFTVDLGRYGQDPLFRSLFSKATDWMAKSRELMLSSDPATLRLSLGLKLGRMGPRDFLASYAFVAWLLEARQVEEVNALLQRLAKGEDVDKAFQGSLGMTVEDAEARLKRWLRETAKD